MKKYGKLIIVFLLIILGLIIFGRYDILFDIIETIFPLIIMGTIIGIGTIFYLVGKIIGGDKARRKIKKELKKLEISNPYIYFRDIPNRYGIGVSLKILNVKVSKKDFLAGILDLCAKGYIKLKQVGRSYEIVDNNKDRSTLLKNEIYLLDWITNSNKSKINLREWVNLCEEDALNLGVVTKEEKYKYKPLFNMDTKYAKNLIIVSYIYSVFLLSLWFYYLYDGVIVKIIFPSLVLSLFLMWVVFLIVFVVMLFIGLLYDGKILTYNFKKNNMLTLTELGRNEYYELCALGKFLSDFGRFTDKNVEEIVIWEQFLSYAIMFRLSTNIISTGYEKLMINDCFIIDDLDKIIL